MSKRNYMHVQELLPEIEAMIQEGKTQREIAEHLPRGIILSVSMRVQREDTTALPIRVAFFGQEGCAC